MSLAERLARTERPDRIAEIRNRLQDRLVEVLGPKLYDSTVGERELHEMVHVRLRELMEEEEGPISSQERAVILQQIGDSVTGLGPLETFLRDPQVTEIMVNNWDTVYVERGGKIYWTGAKFFDDNQLRRTIDKIVARVGRRIDEASPYVDARLPDGSRVNAIIPPLAIDGPVLTIRKFSADPFVSGDLVSMGTVTQPVADFLYGCVQGRMNILVSGGTGAGKTTMLGALLSAVDPAERLVIVEDAEELRPVHPHVVRLVARPANVEGAGAIALRELVRQALRMRPDRIVVGEVRGAEVVELLAALNTGHDGGCGTFHANSAAEVPARLEALAALGGVGRAALHAQLAGAVQLILQVRRSGNRRMLTDVAVLVRGPSGFVEAVPALVGGEPVAGQAMLGELLRSRGVEPPW